MRCITGGLCIILLICFALSLVSCFPIIGAILSSNTDEDLTEIKSTDGDYSIMVPGNWNLNDTTLNEAASIAVSNIVKEQYIVTINSYKEDFEDGFSLDEFYLSITEELYSFTDNCKLGEPEDIKISDKDAIKVRATASLDKLKIIYYMYALETENYFVEIIAWTLPSKEKESTDVFNNIINSFKIIKNEL